MRLRGFPLVVVLLVGAPLACGKSTPNGPVPATSTDSMVSVSVSVPAPPPVRATTPKIVSAPARGAVPSRCCRVERKEGKYGPEAGIHSSYSADIVTRANGDRLFGNEDVVTDTAELYEYAKSMKRTLTNQRRISIIGETPLYVSLSIDDVGDTGSGNTARHSGCKTLRLGTATVAKPEDALTPEAAARVVPEARKQVAAAGGKFRFATLSWALLDAGKIVRFCAPEEGEAGGRFDVDVPLNDGELKTK